MDIPANPIATQHAPAATDTAPPPAQPDGRAVADLAASKTDPRPEIPLPLPPTTTQSAMVGRAALSDTDVAPKRDASGTSSAERTLKPYGINMLPEKTDASQDR